MNARAAAAEPVMTPLIAAVIGQMFQDSAATTNALLESYEHRAEKADATLALVRGRISALLSASYMPTSSALIDALWPSEAEIRDAIGDRGAS